MNNPSFRALSTSRVAAAVLIAAAFGCDTSPSEAPSTQLLVSSDKTLYSLASDTAAAPLLVNLGPSSVYAPMNEYVYVERFEAGQWRNRQPWFAVDGAGISFRIGVEDTLRAWPMSFGYVGRQPGTYRFVFEVAFDSLGRHLVPEGQRVSAAFDVLP